MSRIFPLDLNASPVTYYNYSNYLNWISYDAKSLQDYLRYFNPDFEIYNQTLYYIVSNTWESEEKTGETISNTNHEYDIASLKLKWRQGVFNPDPDAYIVLGDERIPFPVNSTIFARKWTHSGEQDKENSFFTDFNNYFIMVQPLASLYTIRTTENAFKFDWIENGQTVLGTNLTFSLEGGANRYIVYKPDNLKWSTASTEWSIDGAHWDNNNDKMTLNIGTKSEQVWTNSYPLMHELRITNGDNSSEEFIVDNSFEIENSNVANHSTVRYTIKVENVNATEIEKWIGKVFVNII